MSEPRILARVDESKNPVPGAAWQVAQLAGWLFVLVGGIDTALVWYPTAFGRPEWEFGSITAALNGLPLPVLGLTLVLGAALRFDQRMLSRSLAGLCLLLALVIMTAGVLYATNVPLALRAVGTAGEAHLGLMKSITKTAVQLICYPAGLAAIAWRSWKLQRSVVS
jgi:hypothetical protein